MKKIQGFNLLELMIAISMSAVLITVVVEVAWALYNSFIFTINQQNLNQNIQTTLQLIKKDLEKAGVFGSFSFHTIPAEYSLIQAALPACSTAEYCNFDTQSLGLRVQALGGSNFSSFNASISAEGISVASEVLRIQYGNTKVAYLNPYDHHGASCATGFSCTIQNCALNGPYKGNTFLNLAYFVNTGIDTSPSVYMLVSSNYARLLQFANSPFSNDTYILSGEILINFGLSSGCPNNNNVIIQFESAIAGSAPYYNYRGDDPDMYTMQLVNFNTRYYFLGTKNGVTGLYVKDLNSSGSLSSSNLISTLINSLSFKYKVDTTSNFLNNYPNSSNNYRYLSTGSMSTNDWANVRAVTIIIGGSSKQAVGFNNAQLGLTESDTVNWL